MLAGYAAIHLVALRVQFSAQAAGTIASGVPPNRSAHNYLLPLSNVIRTSGRAQHLTKLTQEQVADKYSSSHLGKNADKAFGRPKPFLKY